VSRNSQYENNEHTSSSTAKSNTNIHLAVVTFSGQIELIRGVLSSIVPQKSPPNSQNQGNDNHTAYSTANMIPIRGEDGSWKPPYPPQGWWPDDADVNYDSGKQTHMLSAIREIESLHGGDRIRIGKSTTLLIDDDDFNVQVARQNGVRAVRLYPSNPGRVFADIMGLR